MTGLLRVVVLMNDKGIVVVFKKSGGVLWFFGMVICVVVSGEDSGYGGVVAGEDE
ncbi:hypothetical protein TSUD_383150 [Trifolium subterraneum]|uniref:Uncharacterized protein n=1 Tax=Trifolium subterraneum TaxID=3900 RepID=A0A2Z6LT25_TRISU|nr:hypothetical protein TSUD_383150 [Trifolium subterraneum]